jgi:poly(A) polymerase
MTRDRLTELLAFAQEWTPPAFPLSGLDVIALGIAPGEQVGRLLSAVHDWWIAGDRASCLVRVEDAVTSTR